jgi:recombination protein RecR
MLFAKPLAELIAELERLPNIGPKSAQRLAYHLLKAPRHEVLKLAEAIRVAKEALRLCQQCQNITEQEFCDICRDPRRDRSIICVVAEPKDIGALERIHEYRGLYHVMHGLLSPMDGVGPEQLRLRELLNRLQDGGVHEIILATNPTLEGDATALYLGRLLKPLGVRVTRLAQGMAVGGELDYADSATLLSALEFRREI